MDKAGLVKNVFHYNAMISVTEKDKNLRAALDLLKEMDDRGIEKNEIT
jgi:pentatricopeptide repeat protein